MPTSLSVIIPSHNAAAHLGHSLQALRESFHPPDEIIVVDDGSSDGTSAIAQQFGAIVLSTLSRRGPAFARNLASKYATGNVLLFLDADVCVHLDTVSKIVADFDEDSELDAVIGSYDYDPVCQDFLSQYRNLMHAYVHQTGLQRASTFWSGCGAVRREVFLAQGGFNEAYTRPAVEDIELGYRLRQDGRKILLDHEILVAHMKRWTFWSLIKTDIVDRGIPWTELILRDRCMPNDLNLRMSQRTSVVLSFLLIMLCATLLLLRSVGFLFPIFTVAVLLGVINVHFYAFLARRRGIGFMVAALLFHFLYYFNCGVSFVLGAIRHYSRRISGAFPSQSSAATPLALLNPTEDRHCEPHRAA